MEKKTVLITGGAGEIAKSIKSKLEEQELYIVYSPDRYELDVNDESQIRNYLKNKNIDILINNAGYINPSSLDKITLSDIKSTIGINLLGPLYISSLTASRNPRIKIVNIGSSAATNPRNDWSLYCAAKAGLVHASNCWYMDGFDSITISPGRTKTNMRKKLYGKEDAKTLLKPDQVANVVISAISGAFGFGVNIDINVDNIGDILNEKKSY